MNLFPWFRRPVLAREQRISEAKIQRVLGFFSLPVLEIEPGLWSVIGECHDTYRVCLFISADEEKLNFMASCQLYVERDLLPRELLLTLLEENHRFEQGAFRLVPQEDRRLIVLGRVMDNRTFADSELFQLGEALMERMQRIIARLYGMELIIDGPKNGNSQPDVPPFKRKDR